MEHQDAINIIREHLTSLHANTNVYEDGTYHVIYALEELAIPALEKEIPKPAVVKLEFNTPNGREYLACPNGDCGEYIRYKYSIDKAPYPERCGCCGQLLDWG